MVVAAADLKVGQTILIDDRQATVVNATLLPSRNPRKSPSTVKLEVIPADGDLRGWSSVRLCKAQSQYRVA